MNNLISVGIPTYNSAKFLKRTIQSVLNQTYKNFELIITDDGSTDETKEIIASFNDFRIKFISDNQNRGISYRLNQQIQMARGVYFARMDSDDIMHPERLEKQLSFLLEKQFDIVGTSAYIIDDEDKILGYRQVKPTQNIEQAFKRAIFIHPTVMGKTEWFLKNPYREELIGVEDFELWIRTFEKSSFGYLDEKLLFYRDPLKFKLKTYLFRQKQIRTFFEIDGANYLSKKVVKQLIQEAYFKSFLVRFISFIGFDSFLIKRRNSMLSEIESNNAKKIIEKIK